MSYADKQIAKRERKLLARTLNQFRHTNSVRHVWMPASEQELDNRYAALDVPEEFKRETCLKLISREYGDTEMLFGKDVEYLETIIRMMVHNNSFEYEGKSTHVKMLRERSQVRFSANKFRMLYHMRASGADYTKVNDYHACSVLLSRWHMIYGRQWEGEPFHIDHIIPMALAGSKHDAQKLNQLGNLCMLYPKHNLMKSKQYPSAVYYKIKHERIK